MKALVLRSVVCLQCPTWLSYGWWYEKSGERLLTKVLEMLVLTNIVTVNSQENILIRVRKLRLEV